MGFLVRDMMMVNKVFRMSNNDGAGRSTAGRKSTAISGINFYSTDGKLFPRLDGRAPM